MKKIKKKILNLLYRLTPTLFNFLVSRGFIEEPGWTNLKLDRKKELDYLQDAHRNRFWFCDFLMLLKHPRVLEIGAGAMFEIRTLKKREFLGKVHYNIVDISREVIERGQRLFPEVHFQKGNINKLPYRDNSFDVTYCRAVIEHQPSYERPIKEIWRVTKGVAIIALFRWSLGNNVYSRVKKISNSYNVHEVIDYCKDLGAHLKTFILLKEDQPGVNHYETGDEIRTSDHLILFLQKDPNLYTEKLEQSLSDYRDFLIEEPYQGTTPRYSPSKQALVRE